MATGNDMSAAGFNQSLSNSPPTVGIVPLNLISLWAWDSIQANWYFYSPSMDASGLKSYIATKGYLDFSEHAKTLGNGVGFWVSKP